MSDKMLLCDNHKYFSSIVLLIKVKVRQLRLVCFFIKTKARILRESILHQRKLHKLLKHLERRIYIASVTLISERNKQRSKCFGSRYFKCCRLGKQIGGCMGRFFYKVLESCVNYRNFLGSVHTINVRIFHLFISFINWVRQRRAVLLRKLILNTFHDIIKVLRKFTWNVRVTGHLRYKIEHIFVS